MGAGTKAFCDPCELQDFVHEIADAIHLLDNALAGRLPHLLIVLLSMPAISAVRLMMFSGFFKSCTMDRAKRPTTASRSVWSASWMYWRSTPAKPQA